MGICPKEFDTCQNAGSESPRRAEGNQYQSIVNRENSLLVPSVVSRKNETQPSSQPVLTVESKYSLKLFSEPFLSSLPVDKCLFSGVNQSIPFR